MIEVNNLVKRYGNHTAVDHLSFKIEKGKIYGFLGPNGAGKSTTMNMIIDRKNKLRFKLKDQICRDTISSKNRKRQRNVSVICLNSRRSILI